MFSGIVECTGEISKVINHEDILSIEVLCPDGFNKNLKGGASISVDGVCLTSKDNGNKALKFDVIGETISRTNFSKIVPGDKVNLERSIKASSEIGGHLMSGHIHCIGKVIETQVRENTKDMFIEISNKYSPYLIEKGYIGINGCSLTIGEVINNGFYIHLIPETLKITNISKLDLNDIVNIEIDQNTIAIVDTVNKVLLAQKSS